MRRTTIALVLSSFAAFAIPLSVTHVADAKLSWHKKAPGLEVPAHGTFSDGETGGSFSGKFEIKRFEMNGDELSVVGELEGTMSDEHGDALGTIEHVDVSLPLALDPSTCPELHIVLGPGVVTVEGREVQLDEISFDLKSLKGPGKLLSSMLCGVIQIVDGGDSSLAPFLSMLNTLLYVG